MTKQETQDYVYSFMTGKGLPLITVAAIMGNIQGENSTWGTTVEESNGVGLGLCQWSFGRRTQLENYGTDLQSQCEFLWSELTGENLNVTGADYQWIANPADSVDNGEGFYCSNDDFLSGNGTIEFLTKAFCYCWERPAYATNHLDSIRIPYANIFYEHYSSGGGGGTVTPDPDPDPEPDPEPETPERSSKKSGFNFVLFNARNRRLKRG